MITWAKTSEFIFDDNNNIIIIDKNAYKNFSNKINTNMRKM